MCDHHPLSVNVIWLHGECSTSTVLAVIHYFAFQDDTGWAKLNGANAVSFVVLIVKHDLENFDNFWQVK